MRPITPGLTQKRHHFVPRALQKRFATRDGGLFVYDAVRPQLGVRCDTPANLFVRTHLYSTLQADGSRDAHLEGELSKIEGDADPTIEKIVDAVRSGKLPQLSIIERKAWDRFLYAQWRRVPQTREEFGSKEHFRQSIPLYMAEFEQLRRPLTAEEKRTFVDEDFLSRTYQNAHVGVLRKENGKVLDVLKSRGLAFAKAPPRKSFILGSKPVVRFTTSDTADLRDERVEVWLPISSDVAVTLGSRKIAEALVALDPHQTRKLNEAIARQSLSIAGPSEALIRSLKAVAGTQALKQRTMPSTPPAFRPRGPASDC